ncbi:histidine phosphatase family protein [Alsobacter sp. SYSU M60028]|uniref:Histidine phosphatase family protein n=1 Tax=Alsobacter ponti TaxID=2962936 RepID=A0ABT1LC50_9HYPH|nr:histidine phosphatase family protein [Alsobacter ponti]MCP8939067.1 histidine phosphatase family protein [Alsobacter ponti]
MPDGDLSADAAPAAGLRLFFVRHGETDWNAEGRLQGQKDIPINARGRQQAAEVADRLRRLRPDAGSLPWIVSPLGRTRETAEIARATLGLSPDGYAVEDRLKEISFGRWEGMTWREVRKAEPEAARGREGGKWGFVPPGGESYAMLSERVRPWTAGLSGDYVVVAHGGVARALMYLLAGTPGPRAASVDIWQGRLLVFEKGGCFWA